MKVVIKVVLVNMYGKIENIIISEKLSIGLCNPDSDWIKGFSDDFEEEILIHNHKMKTWSKYEFNVDYLKGRYNLSEIVKKMGWIQHSGTIEETIAEHLIEIQVINFEESILQKKNKYMDNPTCEPQYTDKFLRFCDIIQHSSKAGKELCGQIPFIIYNSYDDRREPLIINFLESMANSNICINTYNNNCVKSLQYIGRLLDEFLSSDEDFWLFDYIINAIYDNQGTDNAYSIFKTISLIEMLIINANANGHTVGEMERKLPLFLSKQIDNSQKEAFAHIMRKFRNKIAHGDFKAVQELLQKYRDSFMQGFWYDEFEYSIENWTYGNICVELNEALANVLWLLISNKEKMLEIQRS